MELRQKKKHSNVLKFNSHGENWMGFILNHFLFGHDMMDQNRLYLLGISWARIGLLRKELWQALSISPARTLFGFIMIYLPNLPSGKLPQYYPKSLYSRRKQTIYIYMYIYIYVYIYIYI